MREFTKRELAFFSVPRPWVPDIVSRFGDDPEIREMIMQFDSDGGLAWLAWIAKQKAWVLTDLGRRQLTKRQMQAEGRWEPKTEGEKARWAGSLAKKAAKLARGEDEATGE